MDPVWKTFEELGNDPAGKVYVDEPVAGGRARFVIMRGPSSLCAYLMITPSDMDRTQHLVLSNLPVHGGVTFDRVITAHKESDLFRAYDGLHAIGWDYAHCYDRTIFSDKRLRDILSKIPRPSGVIEKPWDVRMVYEDSHEAVQLADDCLLPKVLVNAAPITVVNKPFGEFTVRRIHGKK